MSDEKTQSRLLSSTWVVPRKNDHVTKWRDRIHYSLGRGSNGAIDSAIEACLVVTAVFFRPAIAGVSVNPTARRFRGEGKRMQALYTFFFFLRIRGCHVTHVLTRVCTHAFPAQVLVEV